MKTKLFVLGLAIVMALPALALAATRSFSVTTIVPELSMQFGEITIHEINDQGTTDKTDDVWTTYAEGAPISLVTAYDSEFKIFRGTRFWAVDAPIIDNSGKDWQLTYSATSIVSATDPTVTLDGNIIVGFSQVVKAVVKTDPDIDTPLLSGAYKDNMTAQFTKTMLQGGWLRIYYGIATGNTDPAKGRVDPAGVTPIPLDQLAGSYLGTITLTATP